mgnify:FL=1
MKYTSENITNLSNNEIFVFGSNESGIHGAGAALLAKNKFGAIQGKGFGLHGQSFAIPTKDINIRTLSLDEIQTYVYAFKGVVLSRPDLHFIITKIGCGLAGYTDNDIAPLFSSFLNIENISLPIEFVKIINK